MGLTLVSNDLPRNAVRSIQNSQRTINDITEKLSTGSKINSAKDGGLELSRIIKIRAQIGSVATAAKNVVSAISKINTADIVLNEISDMLARIRELAVQASDSSLTSDMREALKNEKGQLTAEIDSLAANAMNDKRRLLDGNFNNIKIQKGPNPGDSFAFSIGSPNPILLGAYAALGPTRSALTAAQNAPANTTTDSEDIIITANGITTTIDVSSEDSAKATATKVNAIASQTLVNAEAKTYGLLFSTNSSSENYTISVNGTATSTFSISNSSVTDAVSKINLISGTTGVVASATTGNQVLLEDSDGGDITIENTASGTSLDIQAVQFDGQSTQGNAISLAAGGSNNNDASTLIGTLRLSSFLGFSVQQSGDSSLAYATTGTPALSSLSDLSLATANESSEGLAVIDGAINQVTRIRGNLSAVLSRLEFNERFLEFFSDALEVSKAKVQDADFAVQSALLAKSMVLQKTGAALLAQANAGQDLVSRLIEK